MRHRGGPASAHADPVDRATPVHPRLRGDADAGSPHTGTGRDANPGCSGTNARSADADTGRDADAGRAGSHPWGDTDTGRTRIRARPGRPHTAPRNADRPAVDNGLRRQRRSHGGRSHRQHNESHRVHFEPTPCRMSKSSRPFKQKGAISCDSFQLWTLRDDVSTTLFRKQYKVKQRGVFTRASCAKPARRKIIASGPIDLI